jgi:esterase/lipase superfamily enzyme
MSTETKVFYAADRTASVGRRSSPERAPLTFGVAEVAVPSLHRKGVFERPSLWRWEFRESPRKHLMLRSTAEWSSIEFFHHLDVELHDGGTRSTLLFIHGHRDTFDTAVLRTAQIGVDLKCAPSILYSWPSSGTTIGYAADVEAITRSIPALATFLKDLTARSAAKPVQVVAQDVTRSALAAARRQLGNDTVQRKS